MPVLALNRQRLNVTPNRTMQLNLDRTDFRQFRIEPRSGNEEIQASVHVGIEGRTLGTFYRDGAKYPVALGCEQPRYPLGWI